MILWKCVMGGIVHHVNVNNKKLTEMLTLYSMQMLPSPPAP